MNYLINYTLFDGTNDYAEVHADNKTDALNKLMTYITENDLDIKIIYFC